MEIIASLFTAAFVNFVVIFSGVDHTTSFGAIVSDYTRFVDYDVEAIKGGTVIQIPVATKYMGSYNMDYDFILENKIPLSHPRFWLSTRTSYSPIKQALQISAVLEGTSRPTNKFFSYNENVATGLILGYDLLKDNKQRWYFFPRGLSIYGGATFTQMGYAGIDNADEEVMHDSVIKYHLGFKAKLDDRWDLILDHTRFNIDFIGVEGTGQNFSVWVNRSRLGIAYNFVPQVNIDRSTRDATYYDVLSTIDPNLDVRIEVTDKEEKLRLEEEKRLEEEARKQEELRIKKEMEELERANKQNNAEGSELIEEETTAPARQQNTRVPPVRRPSSSSTTTSRTTPNSAQEEGSREDIGGWFIN